jgi:hypothetical protein
MAVNPYVTRRLNQASGAARGAITGANLTGNKTAGIVIWLIGAWATGLFIKQLGLPEPACYGIGAGIQWLFTKAETPIWHGKFHALGIAVTIFDVLFNGVGIWPYIRDNFGQTDLWKMIGDATCDPSPPTMTLKLVVTLVIGVIVAAGAEYFWSRED